MLPLTPSQLPTLDAAIIDLDGTMVDTLGDFAEALNRMLLDLALPAIAAAPIETMVGKGSEHLLRSVLKHVLTQMGQAPSAIEIEALYPRAALGTVPARTLMVGDSSNDAQAARAAGCPVVLATYGYNHGEPVTAVDADGWVDSLEQLAPTLATENTQSKVS